MNSVLVLFEFYQRLEPVLKMGRLILEWSSIYKFSAECKQVFIWLWKRIFSLLVCHLSVCNYLFAQKF